MPSSHVKKAKLQQFLVHEIVEGKSWPEADKILKGLLQRILAQFDEWRKSKQGSGYKILSISGPHSTVAQLRDVGTEMRSVSSMQVMYEE